MSSGQYANPSENLRKHINEYGAAVGWNESKSALSNRIGSKGLRKQSRRVRRKITGPAIVSIVVGIVVGFVVLQLAFSGMGRQSSLSATEAVEPH